MKKLSLIHILEDLDADLERFSSEIEEDEETSAPQALNPQQVWGGNSLPDDPDQYAQSGQDIYSQHGITQQDMSAWLDRISAEGFTPEIYQEMTAKVGDMDNFLLDIQEAMPQIYAFFENSGLQKAIPKLQTNPNAAAGLNDPKNRMKAAPIKTGQSQMSLQGALNQGEQASWEELADRGRSIYDPMAGRRKAQTQQPQAAQAPTPTPGSEAPTNPGRKIRK